MKSVKVVLAVLFIALPLCVSAEDITLIKHAKRVDSPQSTRYTVQKGDTLWKIFLRDYKAKTEDMPYLYKKFRELNPKVNDLNHIVTGQKLVIPQKPIQGERLTVQAAPPDIYMIKQGQHLAMVLREVYGLPDKLIFNEYLNLIRELNPEIEDINHVEPGQKIKMPEVRELVSAVQKAEKKQQIETREEQKVPQPIEDDLKELQEIQEEHKPIEIPLDTKIVDLKQEGPEEKQKEFHLEKKNDVVAAVEPETQAPVPSSKKVKISEISTDKKDQDREFLTQDNILKFQEKKKVQEVATAGQEGKETAVVQESPRPSAQDKSGAQSVSSQPGTGGHGHSPDEKRMQASRLVRNTLMPALQQMGGQQKDKGTYFMPMTGGSSISIDTNEIPVMELDTGRRIILDVNNKISPEIKGLLENTFPSCRIISGPSEDLEDLMDSVLSVSGYFSINKDASPLLVGEEEKVRFSGKWIVYKDFSRHNVFVINILSDEDKRTPGVLRSYASRFGIDLIELGGQENTFNQPGQDLIKKMEHSYGKLLDQLGVAYETDKVLDLVSLEAVKIAYKAPLIVNRVILTENLPEENMSELLKKKDYTLVHTAGESLDKVLNALDIDIEGPPVKVVVAHKRTELELPALKVRDNIILERAIDRDIAEYLASQGNQILMW
jgi:hypothetical protein